MGGLGEYGVDLPRASSLFEAQGGTVNNVRLLQGTDSHHAWVKCLDEGKNRRCGSRGVKGSQITTGLHTPCPCGTPRPGTATACCLRHLSRDSFVPALLKASHTLAPRDLRTAP